MDKALKVCKYFARRMEGTYTGPDDVPSNQKIRATKDEVKGVSYRRVPEYNE